MAFITKATLREMSAHTLTNLFINPCQRDVIHTLLILVAVQDLGVKKIFKLK